MNWFRLTESTLWRLRRQLLQSAFVAVSAVTIDLSLIEHGFGATPDAIVADIKTIIEICRSGDATDSLEAHFLDAKKNRRFLRDSSDLDSEIPSHYITLRSGELFSLQQDSCFYSQKISSVNIYDIMEMLGLKRSFVRTMIMYDKSEYSVACVDNGAELMESKSKTNGTRSITLHVACVGAEFHNTVDCSAGPSRPEKLYNHTPILK